MRILNWAFSWSMLIMVAATAAGQSNGIPFSIVLEEVELPEAPGLQSYAFGYHDGKWLFLAGKTNGLHDHRPPFSFLPESRNTQLFVMDLEAEEVWSASLDGIDPLIAEQLTATNLEFYQRDTVLYLIGGYGYNSLEDEWMTYPQLTAVNIPGLIQSIIAESEKDVHFRMLADEQLAVTGGYLGLIGDRFYLAGGQRFDGRYNPFDGPSFIQTYTNAVRSFEIMDDGQTLSLENVEVWEDAANLHRRDYNLVPQIFPDGSFGYTMFTGVFQYDVDIPWFSTVDIHADGYELVSDFEQLFNQYHTANLAAFDSETNAMYSLFFGGIGMYYVDEAGEIWIDSLVPFVNTISAVKRQDDGTLTEHIMDQTMPGFLGASAEFLMAPDVPQSGTEVIDLAALPEEPYLAGYIFGGIESTQANIFMQFSGSSEATNRLFKVYIHKGVSAASYKVSASSVELLTSCIPNPASDHLRVLFDLPEAGVLKLEVIDRQGRVVLQKQSGRLSKGEEEMTLSLQGLSEGLYFCRATMNGYTHVRRFMVKQ